MPTTYSAVVLSPMMKTLTPALSNAEPPPRAIIIKDPYEVYLRTAPEDRSSDCLTIAKESSAIRTILPLINHNQYVESVLDPGSQVIAMSEAACHALALIYDPQVASTVYARTMDSQITITQRELLSLSPEVRNQVREATSNQ